MTDCTRCRICGSADVYCVKETSLATASWVTVHETYCERCAKEIELYELQQRNKYMSRANIVLVAGTFNRFHDGHRALIVRAVWEAMRTGQTLCIGVTTDEFAKVGRDVPVRSRKERIKDVFEFAASCRDDLEYSGIVKKSIDIEIAEVKSKNDMPFLIEGDILVVSEETYRNAIKLTAGMDGTIITVPMRKDRNGKEIHSTTLIKEEKE